MAGSAPRAVPCDAIGDDVVLERAADGTVRYFRANDPAREEYSYDKPFILELEISRRCNLRCVHCYHRVEQRRILSDVLGDGAAREASSDG
ncbi:MAG: hypothetical protein DRI90_04565 [Deltaproteobacteria bacterium]|nr:MAG: hypothetical protein DRI90_04565 [Deltaproteobacteria bacterium]